MIKVIIMNGGRKPRRFRTHPPQPSGGREMAPVGGGEDDKMEVGEEERDVSVKGALNLKVKVSGVGGVEWEELRNPGPANRMLASGPPAKKRKVDETFGQVVVGDVDGVLSDDTSAFSVLKPPAPLLNSAVLTNLFEVCPPRDIATFRLVCKNWRDLSLAAWRKRATLKFKGNPAKGDVYIEEANSLNQFVEYFEEPGMKCGVKPFQRVSLRNWTFNMSRMEVKRIWTLTGSYLASSGEPSCKMKAMDEWASNPSDRLTERFRQLTGSLVTSLDLHDCRFSSAEFWRIAYNLCPNLTRLSLWNCSFVGSSSLLKHSTEHRLEYKEPVRGKHGHLKCLVVSYSELPVSWLELLSHFESLTSLEVKDYKASVGKSLLNAIKVIRIHSGSRMPLALTHFDIRPFRISHHRASHDKFSLVQELNLPLKSLIVRAHPRLDLEFVSDILQRHSGTLEYLKLEASKCFWRRNGRMEGKFPCPVPLEKLQELKIVDVLMESTEILLSVPNLQSLSISGEEGEVGRMRSTFATFKDWQGHNPGAVLLSKLAKLFYSGSFGYSENLVILAKLMPNVDELYIDLRFGNDEDFSIVCENWKRLKGLSIELDEEDAAYHLTDKGLTGGSLQIEKPDMGGWVHKAVSPSITDLKELQRFFCLSNRFTEVAVYNGFLQVPDLRSLTLSSRYATSGQDDDEEDDPIKASTKQYCFDEEARNDLREQGIIPNFI